MIIGHLRATLQQWLHMLHSIVSTVKPTDKIFSLTPLTVSSRVDTSVTADRLTLWANSLNRSVKLQRRPQDIQTIERDTFIMSL